MKLKSFVAIAVASLATSFAIADQGDVLITFSTPGPDKYADGTTVANGEWYAICWAADGQFDGLKTDGTPVNAEESLILAAPLAKDGKCPFTAFEFARQAKYDAEGSKFSIFMLDTRDANGQPAKTLANVFVKKATAATTIAKGGADSLTVVEATAAGAAGAAAWNQAALQDDAVGATITAFEVVGDNVQLKVTGLSGKCVIKTGSKVDALNSFVIPSVDANDEATFILPKDQGNFFSAVSVPAK